MVDGELELEITETENRFIGFLKEFQQSSQCPTQKPLRLVGGWVRDRLMGIKSHDIDIALEDCTGRTFVEAFEEWLHKTHHDNISVCKSMVVKANAAKSKHLETAILDMPALGLSIDFVNLRSEVYDANSRIPTHISFGTPAEDCLRRDLTINSIFFNLQNLVIEDWSGKGIDDLRNGILRTPQDPERTFLDDPLRILRILRFAAKLDRTEDSAAFCPSPIGPQAPKLFQLEKSIGEAVMKSHIRSALTHKVTKERLRAELCAMFEYPNISQGLYLLYQWKLLSCLVLPLSLDFSPDYDCSKLTQEYPKIGLLVEHIMIVIGRKTPGEYLSSNDPLYNNNYANFERRGVMILAAMFANHHKFKVHTKGGEISAAQECLNSLKSKVVGTHVSNLLDIAFEFCADALAHTCERARIIAILRKRGAARWWEYALILAKCMGRFNESAPISGPSHFFEQSLEDDNLTDEILEEIKKCRHYILEEQNLDGLWEYKPLLNGGRIIELLKEVDGKSYKPTLVGKMMNHQADFIAEHWDPSEEKRQELEPKLIQSLKEYAKSL